MVRHMPGFYYDGERKKYFRIQPNHAGPGQQHSRQAVEQEESASKRRKLAHEHLTRRQRETISPSTLLTHPLLGRFSLQNKLGNATRLASEGVAAYYVASLSRNPVYCSNVDVPAFVVDEANSTIIFAESHHGDGNDTLHCLRPVGAGNYPGTVYMFEAMSNSFVDMSISSEPRKLFYASRGPWGTRTVLLDVPRASDEPYASAVNHTWNFDQETAWQTSVSPNGGSFAVASTRGLRLYRMHQDQTLSTLCPNHRNRASCEYMAVAFGQDDRITMAGKRSGGVAFFDSRTQDYVSRLSHEDGVSAIRPVDENRIVVRGLQKMSLYDLRYTKAPSKKQLKSKIATDPYRVFPWENTSFDFGFGFDYNAELGIIATASSKTPSGTQQGWPSNDRNHQIYIFSARTGKSLHSRSLSASRLPFSQPVKCIKFPRIGTLPTGSELMTRVNGPVSLLASYAGIITEWTCQGLGLRHGSGE